MDEISKIEMLKNELEIERSNVYKAAELGKQLLEDNQNLESRLESMRTDHVSRVEALEQEKYSLQLKVTTKENIERSLTGELEQIKELVQNAKENEKDWKKKEAIQEKRIKELENQNEALQTDLEQNNLIVEHLKETVSHQENLVKDANCKLKQQQNVSFNDEELVQLHQENSTLKNKMSSLQLELKHAKDTLQQVIASKEKIEKKIYSLHDEMEEKQILATSYYNALEKSREDVTDLQVQLDMVKMQTVDPDSKGNSLFAEVDDRRKTLEKKLITLKVEHDSLKEHYNIKKQQLMRLKGQIAALLQMSSHEADHSQLQRLQTALSQSRGEVQMLSEKLKNLEHLEGEVSLNRKLEDFHRQFPGETLGDKKMFVEFLEEQLKCTKTELTDLKQELQTQRVLRMEATDKQWKTEKSLHQTEKTMEKIKAENMRLYMKSEELRQKYGEGDDRSKHPIFCGKIEKIPIVKKETVAQQVEEDENKVPSTETDCASVPEITLKEANTELKDGSQEEKSHPVTMVTDDVDCKVESNVDNLEGRNKSSKRVTMCDTVSVLNESGTVSQQNIAEECDEPSEKTAKMSTQHDSVKSSKKGGKKHHNVIRSKDAMVKNE
ncbi:protein Spindly-like, partial [Saccoglossus kowalevskii]